MGLRGGMNGCLDGMGGREGCVDGMILFSVCFNNAVLCWPLKGIKYKAMQQEYSRLLVPECLSTVVIMTQVGFPYW